MKWQNNNLCSLAQMRQRHFSLLHICASEENNMHLFTFFLLLPKHPTPQLIVFVLPTYEHGITIVLHGVTIQPSFPGGRNGHFHLFCHQRSPLLPVFWNFSVNRFSFFIV
jgi:hypothetical protein